MACTYKLVIWHVLHIILVNIYRSRSKQTITCKYLCLCHIHVGYVKKYTTYKNKIV